MTLFCTCCGELHRYSPGDVERILYALQGAQADAYCEEAQGTEPFEEVACLTAWLDSSHDPEAYLEWTDGWVQRRRECQKEWGP